MQVSDRHSVMFTSLRPPWTAARQDYCIGIAKKEKKKKSLYSSSKKKHVGARTNFSFNSN